MEVRTAAGAGSSAETPPPPAGDLTHESRMDEHLRSLGYYRKKVAKDGSCLFRAVAEQVLHCQGLHTQVRAACVDFLRQNRSTYELFIEGDFEKYLENLQDPQSWVGQVEITALSELYKHDFIIFQEPGHPQVELTDNGFPDKVRLCFLNGNHYDSVYPQSFVQSAAVCQSILYELLYERVCGVERGAVTHYTRGGARENDKSSEESDLEEDEDSWPQEEAPARERRASQRARGVPQGRGRALPRGRVFLSTKVQKSLNPAVFRNVEYDVWLRSQRLQQQRDFCMAAGMQYSVGDTCRVQLSGGNRVYGAVVRKISSVTGPVTVFIPELGREHTVALLNLRLPSDDGESWQKVSEKSRKPAPQTPSEWDSRGSGRPGRGGPLFKQEQAAGRSLTFRRSDHAAPPTEDQSEVLELLHNDEQNFPSLGSPGQAVSEVVKKGAERRNSRKKEPLPEQEPKEEPEKNAPRTKTDRNHQSQEPGRTSSPTVKEKTIPPSPSLQPAVVPQTTSSAVVVRKTTVPPQIRPADSDISQSGSTPGSLESPAPRASPDLLAKCPITDAHPCAGEPSPNTPGTSDHQTHLTESPATSVTDTRVESIATNQNLPSCSSSLPPVVPSSALPGSLNPPAPSSSLPPTDGAGASPVVQPAVDHRAFISPTLTSQLSSPAPASSPLVSGVFEPSGAQQVAYHHPQWSQLVQDPLYPGFPLNEKGDVEPLPAFSLTLTGEDLPPDKNVLRFFFNLGVKAYSQPMWPPIAYLGPLSQSYQLQLRGVPPSSGSQANPCTPSWQPEIPAPPQSLEDTHTPAPHLAPGASHMGPAEIRGYNGQYPSMPVQMPPRPPITLNASAGTYAGTYVLSPPGPSYQFSAPPCPQPETGLYPSFHPMPLPPMSLEALNHASYGRIDGLSFVPPTDNNQGAMSFQGGVDFKPVNIPVPMTGMEAAPLGGPCPVVPFPNMAGMAPLANGRQGGVFPKTLHPGALQDEPTCLLHSYSPEEKGSFEEAEQANVDLRVGQSFYSQAYRGGGRRGHGDRGGFRGRGYRGRKDDQSYYSRGHYSRRGAGTKMGYQ